LPPPPPNFPLTEGGRPLGLFIYDKRSSALNPARAGAVRQITRLYVRASPFRFYAGLLCALLVVALL
jgi:hypothetical protein